MKKYILLAILIITTKLVIGQVNIPLSRCPYASTPFDSSDIFQLQQKNLEGLMIAKKLPVLTLTNAINDSIYNWLVAGTGVTILRNGRQIIIMGTGGSGTITQGRFDTLLSTIHSLLVGNFGISVTGNTNILSTGYSFFGSTVGGIYYNPPDTSMKVQGRRVSWTQGGQNDLPIKELVYDPTENLITEHIYTTFNQEYDSDLRRHIVGSIIENIEGGIQRDVGDDISENVNGNINQSLTGSYNLTAQGFTYNGKDVIPQKGQVTFDDNGGNDSLAAVGNSCHTGLNITSANIVTVTPVGSVTGVHGYNSINANDYLSVTVYGGYFIIQRKPGGTPYLTVNWSLQ